MNLRRSWPMRAILVVMVLLALVTTAFAAGEDPTEASGTKMVVCTSCDGLGICTDCYGTDSACETCGGSWVIPGIK